MRPASSPVHSWLRVRVRVFCLTAFTVSLFMPPYIPNSSSAAPPDIERNANGYLLAEEGFLMKTSSLTEQGTRSAYSQGIIHTVDVGESITSIAKSSFLDPETVRWANKLGSNAQVKTGDKLLILPVDGVLHSVKRGQNLQMIADLYGVPSSNISRQNKIKGSYLLTGQELIIPEGKPIVEAPPKPPKAIAEKPTPSTQSAPLKGKPVPPAIQTAKINPTYGVFQIPCDCFYTQYFSASHFGVDMQYRGGAPIFAGEAGTVIRADYGWNGGYGNVIEIDHGNGLVSLYAHNKELYVKKGDFVERGQVISFMGNTGRVHGPTGIHLHFEVHVNGIKKNPLLYLQQ